MNVELSSRRQLGLALGALGVVYGDIGTSPLYTIRGCFHGLHALQPTRFAVLGVLSCIIWTLTIIVSVKYLTFVMRANNRGEGGIIALLALTLARLSNERVRLPLLIMGACGAALLLGEGMITPAISVLSAVEGLGVATPGLRRFVVPITVTILVALFLVQRLGTGRVGHLFSPITFFWFVSLALLGLRGISLEPGVLAAFNPVWALKFLYSQGLGAFFVLGAVFLAVTGVEALYADMGHFGVGPIRLAWYAMVFPALLLNYLGQGAWLLAHPTAIENPFYNLAPSWGLYPLVGLATAATIVASQAIISCTFSMAHQAMQMGFLPRLNVRHTSSTERGQIYLGGVNQLLMVACIGLVLGFQSSNRLAAAYGIGVSLTVMMTTLLLAFAARFVWGWAPGRAALMGGALLLVELVFFAANTLKFDHGGWFPVAAGALIYLCMATWFRGRKAVQKQLQQGSLPLGVFLAELERRPLDRVAGTAVFMTANAAGTPDALLHNLKHNKVLHERVVVLRFAVAEAPYVDPAERVQIERLSGGFFRVTGFFGFRETPDLDAVRAGCANEGVDLDPMKTTYFLGRETILATARPGLARWRKHLFGFMARNSQQATAFFRLPPNRVVELGMQVEI